MTKDEAIAALGERVVPLLQEFGVESLVMAGYVNANNTGRERFVAAMLPKSDPAATDGMNQVLTFATIWAAPDSTHNEPH